MSTVSVQQGIYHEGELAVQARAGATSQARSNGRVIADKIIPGAVRFARKQSYVVLGSVAENNEIWASIVVGRTGFIAAQPQSIDIDLSQALRSDADPLWNNLAQDDRIGMLVIDLRSRARLRVNGRAGFPVKDRLHVDVEQAYPNCPQYIQRRNYRPNFEQPDAPDASLGIELSALQQQWITRADTMFVASGHPDEGVDASHRGGNPGFIEVASSTRLRIPDYAGNSMYNTLGNFEVNPRAGLLIPDFERERTLQLTGHVDVLWDVDDPHNRSGGTGRFWDFEIDRWIQIDNSLPGISEFLDYSPHNPSLGSDR